ncbi:uncharacterized protein N7469_008191 [Penicillium citrinum]|uniref:Uncharacterized protein n=1 Tax=Penicillium citrinum TaxID=5077 RepID=A0A9W9TJ71_PENCI|nr:uncharacterized protein N7469_008191 [Penicillium citrinum]KAJ5224688.1 hypothetical protein N7469_008191 [Penicillium citrinum]
MYTALIKRQMITAGRRSAFCATRPAQALLHEKANPKIKGNEEFFVTTTFPDDYEGSRLSSELENKTPTTDQGTTEQHKADIYESLWGKEATGGPRKPKQTTARDEALETEHEPEIDEM